MGLETLPDMDDAQFTKWRELLEARTGMHLPDERRSFLVTSLGIRMRQLGYTDYQAYYDHVLHGRRGAVEWATLVDRLTVHETRFFRHASSLELIRECFLPQWVEENTPPFNLHAWSVGCSTGEEPYSLAMVIDEFLEGTGQPYYFGITACDISLAALSVGRRGLYHRRKLRQVDAILRRKYFNKKNENEYEVKRELRQRVCFAQLNVLELGTAPVGRMHLIFCQNLLIYFDREKRVQILGNLTQHLEPGGMLILGAGEILGWAPPALERMSCNDTLAFRRRPEAAGVRQ